MKSGSVSSEDVNRGKALLKAAVLNAYATDRSLIAEIGAQAAITKQVQDANSLVSAIDGITQQDVQEVIK